LFPSGATRAGAVTLLVLCIIGLSGCAQGPSAPEVKVQEYPLVEQSTDNPTHRTFQDYVPPAVKTRTGVAFQEGGEIAAPNRALAPFGYRLAGNPKPPFSSYALYHGDILVQTDIARFWSVSIKASGTGERSNDFLFPYETLSGEQLAATSTGIISWPGSAGNQPGAVTDRPGGLTPPVYFGSRLAYARSMGSGVAVDVYAGSDLLYSGDDTLETNAPVPVTGQVPEEMHTWSDLAGTLHWAVESTLYGSNTPAGRLVIDGQDINQLKKADDVFGLQIVASNPLYFYQSAGKVQINFSGKDLPYYYDQVVHDNPPETAMFNPDSESGLVWFYALRDGLWYYVEISRK
jgi:hypothetical protein